PPSQTKNVESGEDVPFAVIDEVPVFPGCEELTSNNGRKECMTGKITDFVSSNFNAKLGEELGLTGINRVIVQFKIDKTGNVVEARARAPKPELEEEAIRVVTSMPKFSPGKQNGTPVNVIYSLPIVFDVGDE
ncbi:energy transducer TonB, partial [Salegentibacter sp.]|uniref:energy transducer TonB n=1 Tax=Salegentibacter sp. TaxID=1903072 RepID=UPI003567F47D